METINKVDKVDKNKTVTLTLPVNPPKGLLVSMAMRMDHSFGLEQQEMIGFKVGLSKNEKIQLLKDMRRVYEEIIGTGFYKGNSEEKYASMFLED